MRNPKPYRQGELDGLCGVYAICNATMLLSPRPRRRALQKIVFDALVSELPAPRLRAGLHKGLEAIDLSRAFKRAQPVILSRSGVELIVTAPFARKGPDSLQAYIAQLKEWSESAGHAVIITFHVPWLSHWTVVRRVTKTRLETLDSQSHRSLELDRFGLKGTRRFAPDETLLLRRLDGRRG